MKQSFEAIKGSLTNKPFSFFKKKAWMKFSRPALPQAGILETPDFHSLKSIDLLWKRFMTV